MGQSESEWNRRCFGPLDVKPRSRGRTLHPGAGLGGDGVNKDAAILLLVELLGASAGKRPLEISESRFPLCHQLCRNGTTLGLGLRQPWLFP